MTGLEADFVVRRRDGFELDLAIDAPAGSTTALLGPNGAGKSTAVGAIAGLVSIDTGRIVLDGHVLDDPMTGDWVPPEERRIGVVFQDALLFENMTVRQNVAFGPRSRGIAAGESVTRAQGWLERLDLADLADRRPASLSGGEAQRVALGRALAAEPAVLLLDEPFSALDVTARSDLRHVVREHLDVFSGPRLLITHDPAEAFLLGDRIHIIEGGRVTQSGSPDEIRLRPLTPFAADLAGINLVPGVIVSQGTVDTGGHQLTVVDEGLDGPVLVTIQPSAISVHTSRPGGSPRNAWKTRIERIEPFGRRVRLLTGEPLALAVELTGQSLAELGLTPGSEVWLAVKATEITVVTSGD